MESVRQLDRETYRVIVFGDSGSKLLVAPTGRGFGLPSVQVPRWRRISPSMQVSVRDEWGQEVICLFQPDLSFPISSGTIPNYQVMECSEPVRPRSPAEWVDASLLPEQIFVDRADQIAVERSLAECQGYGACVRRGPFARLGWFDELREWVQRVIGSRRLSLAAHFSQLNAGPSFALVRFETSGAALWFKAVGEPHLREFSITHALAELFSRFVPPILATRPEWHGWLASEVDGFNLSESADLQAWVTTATTLAKLQVQSIRQSKALIESGARDYRVPELTKLVRPFLGAMAHLMEAQSKVPPLPLARREVELLGDEIEWALSRLANLGMPDALGHLDLNPGNIILSKSEAVFLDWAEAYVGNPLFSFQYLAEHSRHTLGRDGTADSDLAKAYTGPWHTLVSPEKTRDALALIPMLAAFVYAVSSDAWRNKTRREDATAAGYLRSLTRRMHREALCLRNRRTPCSS